MENTLSRPLVARRGRTQAQGGATLIEVLVAMMVMALIIGPITMSFMVFLRAGPTVRQELDRSDDARRIGLAWTRDVQNVVAGGVNAGSGCSGGPTGTQEVNLVSFQWNISDDATARGEDPITASWVAVGAGEDLKLVRRECKGEVLTSTSVMARKIGRSGVPITTIVQGPVPASPTDFCPVQDLGGGNFTSDTCTIVINGTFKYNLTVTRRVADRSGVSSVLPPPAPTITGAAGRNTYLTVAWTPPALAAGQPPITGYRVFAYSDPNGAPVASAEVDGQSTSADIDGVVNGSAYWVRVQAQNSAQWGELSAPFGAITPNPTTPDAGDIVSVEPLNGQVSVVWSAPLNNGGLAITGWRVYATPSSGAEVGPAVITPGGATTGVIAGLTNGTSYTITVTAVNGLGEGVRSSPSAPVVPFGPAAAAATVIARAGDATATVRWTPPTSDGGRPIIGYTVFTYQGANQANATSSVYKPLAGLGCATTCETTVSITNADYYRFAVQARTDPGGGAGPLEGSRSGLSGILDPQYGPSILANHVRPSTTPSTPAAPTLSVGSGTNAGTYKLTVTVVLPTDNGANAHNLEVQYDRAPTANLSSWATVGSVSNTISGVAGSSKVVTIDNVSSGYGYRVRARVANRGEWASTGDRWSGYSANSGSVVGPGAPGAPTAVVVSRPGGSFGQALNLSFAAPADTGGSTITTYNISCTAPSGTTITRTATSAGSVSLTGTDVRDGRNYSCSVTASNAVGTSAAGSTASTAMPYGECTLRASQTQHIKEGSGVQSTTNAFWVRQRWQNFFGQWQNYREAGLIRWNWGANCSNVVAAMPTTAYVTSANFQTWEESSQDDTHDIVRITSNWTASTQYSNQPSLGSVLGSWDADASAGWRSLNNANVAAAVREMKAGTNDFGFNVRNPSECYLCSGGSAKYTGATGGSPPQLVMSFYSQGA